MLAGRDGLDESLSTAVCGIYLQEILAHRLDYAVYDDACLMIVIPHRGKVDVGENVVSTPMVEGVWFMIVGVVDNACFGFDGFVPPDRIDR